jgi:hypothetical protein
MANEIKIPSSYRYYKLADLKKICGIDKADAPKMLSPVQDIIISDFLQTTIDRNLQLPMRNEKAKSELLVVPILTEVWFLNKSFKPLSGFTFNIEPSKGLKGIADFLISSNPNAQDLESPIMCVFEAKNDAIEDWYGQCGAEMYAARIFNEREGNNIHTIHGAVTNGIAWQFLRLEGNILFIDSQRYSIANLPQLLGAIQKVYDFYK